MKISTKGSMLAAALAALALGAVSAGADEVRVSGQPVSGDPLRAQRAVAYGDLNLASSAGREALQRRIEGAARQVCGTTSFRNAGGLRTAAANRRCVNEATAAALSAMDGKSQSLASVR